MTDTPEMPEMVMRYKNDPRICAHCRWLFSRDFPDGQMNQCRRNAPIITNGLSGVISPVWPTVTLNDWCGDFVDKSLGFGKPPEVIVGHTYTTSESSALVSGVCEACGGRFPNEDCGHLKNARDLLQQPPCRPTCITAIETAAREAAIRECAEKVRGMKRCPFEKGGPGHKLDPDDLCPVCGDDGHLNTNKPIRCQSPEHAILSLLDQPTEEKP